MFGDDFLDPRQVIPINFLLFLTQRFVSPRDGGSSLSRLNGFHKLVLGHESDGVLATLLVQVAASPEFPG